MILAENTKDSADNIIFENITEKDIAITRDILLAERLVQKNIKTINDRGTYFSKENIKKKFQEFLPLLIQMVTKMPLTGTTMTLV